ncbi:DUF4215 domain-containing protein [Nannocystis sp. RBIL2]|uniref:DUF4215 domain-containing protein n=1 Tax=Nannocystis sp. RBIL2 TaxID=2996788 RepID=UPI00226EA923|nr:DUF4215 domain-containing protein [Nannocystis sp. RBIL2]MCY1069996.1 DUF4215 domain-containing protein [Nannocystis sp. RBIL2]
MRPHDLSRPAALFLAGLCALGPLAASAQTPPSGGTGGTGMMGSFPPADAFTIQYWLTDQEGNFVRPLTEKYFKQFINKARCECGQKIGVRIRLKKTMAAYDTTKRLESFVGTQCSTAETALAGQFRRCAQFSSALVPTYQQGIDATFHPIWLTSGVTPNSPSRLPDMATTSGSCEAAAEGESGVWLCAPGMNSTPNCQADEFFIQGLQNINLPSKTGGISFDYLPPILPVKEITATPGDGAVVLSWKVDSSGDINGYRVLCEEAATGQPVPNKMPPRPDPLGIPTGTYFYTKSNLCPDGPFSTFMSAEDNPLGTTSDGVDSATDTDGNDTLGTTGGDDTAGDTDGPTECSNGIVEFDEECDLGNENSDEGECRTDCTLNRCGDGKVHTGVEECDDGNVVDNDGCTNACTSPGCGDGIINADDACDGGTDFNNIPGGPCTPDCQISPQCGQNAINCPQPCGDGVHDPNTEGCDSGPGLSNNSDCTLACQINVCGDGFVLSDPVMGVLEECDEGMANDDNGACTTDCLRNVCGDGLEWTGVEACDDMNKDDTDDCLSNCQKATCGDGVTQAGVEECDLGLNNSASASCDEDCKFTASQDMLNLDWKYVCSGHISFSTKSVRINGLENGKEYNFLLVPYDLMGNPKQLDVVVRATPVETYDLWEQCEEDGGICGASGYCNVSDDSSGGLALFTALAAFGIGGLGVANRRRNRA